jgi:hypothetical protein
MSEGLVDTSFKTFPYVKQSRQRRDMLDLLDLMSFFIYNINNVVTIICAKRILAIIDAG